MKILVMNLEMVKEVCYHSGDLSMTEQRRLASQLYAGIHFTMTCLLWGMDHVSSLTSTCINVNASNALR